MSDLENKINSLLSDPEALSSIINVVKGLSGTSLASANNATAPTKPQVLTENTEISAVPALSNNISNDKDGIISAKSIGLLLALRPFLSEGKREKIDLITRLLKIATLTEFLK